MRSMGISPGDAVLVIEHRGEQDIVYNALVAGISMEERLAGTHGEPAIEASFVADHARERIGPLPGVDYGVRPWHPTLSVPGVVHISHRDWIERRAGLAYEELPEAIPGMCRYCRCTANRACPGGCSWLYPEQRTVCSAPACEAKYVRENLLRTAGRAV
jgi:hypothetical protein